MKHILNTVLVNIVISKCSVAAHQCYLHFFADSEPYHMRCSHCSLYKPEKWPGSYATKRINPSQIGWFKTKIFHMIFHLIPLLDTDLTHHTVIVFKRNKSMFLHFIPSFNIETFTSRKRERLSLSAFLGTEDTEVHIVHISRIIITYTLE